MSLPIFLGYIYGLIQLVICEISLLSTALSKGINFEDSSIWFMLLFLVMPLLSVGLTLCIIPEQEPKHLLIGLTGASLCLAVSSVAIIFWEEFMWTSSIAIFMAYISYPFFLKTFVTGGDSLFRSTYFIKDLTGVKVNWLRIACSYFATLPIFPYFLMKQNPDIAICGFFLHFGVFYFLIEASLVHKATIFREYEDNESQQNRPKVLVQVIQVKEEEKNTPIYKFFEFLRVLT